MSRNHGGSGLSKVRAISLVVTLVLAQVLSISLLQGTMVALPHIQEELGIANQNLQWAVSSYSLTVGAFLLFWGRISDLYGDKPVFVGGCLWLSIWCLGAGFANNEIGFDIMRGLQGIGSAASIPAALGILGRSFPPGPAKSLAFAAFGAGAPTGGGLGLVIGGLTTQLTGPGWRSYFYVCAAIAATTALVGFFVIPSKRALPHPSRTELAVASAPTGTSDIEGARASDAPQDKETWEAATKDAAIDGDAEAAMARRHAAQAKDRTVDWVGATLITVGLVLFTFGLADGEGAPQGWATPYVPTLFAIGVISLIAFASWEYHREHRTFRAPMMRVSIWSKGRISFVFAVAFFQWAGFTGYSLWQTLIIQDILRLTPVLTMVRFLPMMVTGLLLNLFLGLAVARISAYWLFTTGCIMTAVACILSAVQRLDITYWAFQFPSMIFVVFGADLVFVCGTLYCSRVAAHDEQALAGGLFQTVTQIGAAVGLAIQTIVQDHVISEEGSKAGVDVTRDQTNTTPEMRLKGLLAALWTCAAFALFAGLLSALTLWGVGKVGEKKAKQDIDLEGDAATGDRVSAAPRLAAKTESKA